MQLILLSRHGCHLCEEMAADLAQLQDLHEPLARVDWRVEDVDSRADWRERWGAEVPVLLRPCVDGSLQELCRHRLRPAPVLAWLAANHPGN